ncbi:hypothetical protein KV557_06000 [Kitasatospora aureofaciens]|uniref:hypothetical protein n=1 Tax=Kitasatospora aureofaciens TaxID=1894 RepID=UPI001C47F4D6|nr:hypothetical protein [Kitasatospora aureofaciens]MBV6696676.1 hypothetical protein [Kitasatospora aureofaciens]
MIPDSIAQDACTSWSPPVAFAGTVMGVLKFPSLSGFPETGSAVVSHVSETVSPAGQRKLVPDTVVVDPGAPCGGSAIRVAGPTVKSAVLMIVWKSAHLAVTWCRPLAAPGGTLSVPEDDLPALTEMGVAFVAWSSQNTWTVLVVSVEP